MFLSLDIWMTMVCGSIVWGAAWSVWRLVTVPTRAGNCRANDDLQIERRPHLLTGLLKKRSEQR